MLISIRERTEAGVKRAFMFGDEQTSSTGAMSARVVQSAFKNLDREPGSILCLDEPEIGLSDGYTRALGEFIGEQSRTVPKACLGVVVVTHSRRLATGIRQGLGTTPTLVRVSARNEVADTVEKSAGGAFDAWLNEVEERSVEDLLQLPETGLERFRAVHQLTKP